MVAIGINIIFWVFIEKFRERNLGKIFLITGCVLNIAVLFYYKYYIFYCFEFEPCIAYKF